MLFDGGHDDRAGSVATDAHGSIFVGGQSDIDASPVSFVVLKYNAAGTLQWTARPQGLGNYVRGFAGSVATDAAGNVYAAGNVQASLSPLQSDVGWLVVSFDPNGNQRWARLFNSPGQSFDAALSLALNPQKGVYVTGITSDASGHTAWLTIKYGFDGTELWRQIEPGPNGNSAQPVGLAVDAAGNAVVAGSFETVTSGPHDLRVIKYSPQGAVLWRTDYSATAVSDEQPSAVALDTAGNVYVTADRGNTLDPESGSTPMTLKLDANGNQVFVLAGIGQGGAALALDGAGNFVVSGLWVDTGGAQAIAQTSKFSSAGTLLWSAPVFANHIAIDPLDGTTYLARSSAFEVLKFNSAGQQLSDQVLPNGTGVEGLVVDAATGALIATGDVTSGGGDILTARFPVGSTTPPPPPAAPSGLAASAQKGAITLTWTDNANDETGFLIERATGKGAFSQIAQVGANVRTFTNSGLSKNTTFTYRVRAFNASGNSAYSNTVSATAR